MNLLTATRARSQQKVSGPEVISVYPTSEISGIVRKSYGTDRRFRGR
ncbi:hypothetical protein ACJBCE_36135 [Streptomyces sp. NBUL23]